MSNEQTLSIIKPDAVERNLSEDIKNFFKKNNLNIKDSKIIKLLEEQNIILQLIGDQWSIKII